MAEHEDSGTKKVLITGFGPFKEVSQNPSWEGVMAMNKEEIQGDYNIHLYQESIEVAYGHVDEIVPKLWAKLQPNLTIHVGYRYDIACFMIETKACKRSYELIDVTDSCPADNTHCCDGPEELHTDLDVARLCEQFNSAAPPGITAEMSPEAGKFVCEYIYYASLANQGNAKTLFVHVPGDDVLSAQEVAQGLELILKFCLQQLE